MLKYLKVNWLLEKINSSIIQFASLMFLHQKSNLSSEQINNILIICEMGIGNFIFFTPVISNLIDQFNNKKIYILVNNELMYELVDKNFGNEVKIIKYYKNSYIKNILFAYKMKSYNIDVLLTNFLGVKTKNIILGLICNISHRIGHVKNNLHGKYDFFFNHKILINKKHEIQLNIDLLKPFNFLLIDKTPIFKISNEDLNNIDGLVSKKQNKVIIILQVYSYICSRKNWIAEKYVKVAKQLQQKYNAKILLVCSNNERQPIEDIFSNTGIKYINCAGKYTLMETAAIIKYSDLFIGNDGGLGKIANAVNTKSITIWGATEYSRAYSWGKLNIDIKVEIDCSPCTCVIFTKSHKNCINSIKYKCLKDIDYKLVLDKANRLLKR